MGKQHHVIIGASAAGLEEVEAVPTVKVAAVIGTGLIGIQAVDALARRA